MTTKISPDQVKEIWPDLSALLAPAVGYDRNVTLDDVRAKLVSGQCEALFVEDANVRGVIVTEICNIDGAKVCWVSYVAGSVNAYPKQWLSIMREGMAVIEHMAKSIGCTETRIGGRDWSRILPGYLPFDDTPNNLRKAL